MALAALAVGSVTAWVALGTAGFEAWEREVLGWIGLHTPAVLRQALQVLSDLHRPRPILAATAIALAFLLWRRERARAPWLLCAVGGGAALNHLLKHALQRPRPGDIGLPLPGTDFSFPSGHVANATLLYGALLWLFVGRVASPAWRAGLCGAAVVLVGAVAASRLVLGTHYPSDVVAGAAFAIAWLALCVMGCRLWQARSGVA